MTPSLLTGVLCLLPVLESSKLDAALDAVRVATIESDVRFLASDELAGRGTPSPGLEIAGLYIVVLNESPTESH